MTLCRRRKPPTRWLKTLRRPFRQPPLIRGLKDCTAGAWPMPISVIPRTLGSVQRPALARHRIEGQEQPDWLMPSSGSPDACRLPRSQHQDFSYVARTRISVPLTVAHAIGPNPPVCRRPRLHGQPINGVGFTREWPAAPSSGTHRSRSAQPRPSHTTRAGSPCHHPQESFASRRSAGEPVACRPR
jgi:hypothetical protein